MASPWSRELSITYNGYKVGGDQANRILRDLYTLSENYEEGICEFRFTIKQKTQAAFAAECAAAEAAFTTPFKDTSVDLNGTNFTSWSHSGSTGFNAFPEIVKRGEPTDSSRSRTYTIRIKVGLPAPVTGGRRVTKTAINVSYSPARRRHVAINVEYTATGGTAAFTNYSNAADAYANTVLTFLTGTYKLAEQPTTDYDEDDKVVRATRIYEEIIFLPVGGGDPDVRKEIVVISRNKVGPGDTPDGGATINRLVTLNVDYECWINKENSTDLRGKWSTLLAALIGQVRATLGGGSIALVSEDPHFDYTDNKITANLVVMGSTSGGIIENRITTEVEIQTGLVFVPAWHKGPFDRYIFQGPSTDRKTVTTVQRVLAGGGGGAGGGGARGGGLAGGQRLGIGADIQGLGQGAFNLGPGGSFPIFGGPYTGAGQTDLVNAIMGNIGGADGGGGDGGAGGGVGGGGGKGNYYLVSTRVATTPIRLGINGYTLDLMEITIVYVFERADPIDVPAGVASVDPRA